MNSGDIDFSAVGDSPGDLRVENADRIPDLEIGFWWVEAAEAEVNQGRK